MSVNLGGRPGGPAGRAGTTVLVGDDTRLRRDFGTVGLLFTAVGSIIGSGWLFGALNASEIAGPAAIFSWAIGAVMFVFIGLSYSEVGVMFPHSGGVARYPHYAFGSFASFTMGWVTWLAAASVAPIEVEAVTQYATNYLPWLQHSVDGVPVLTNRGLAVSVGLMAVFVLINFIGVRWFARVNNVLVWWKLAIIVLVIVMFFVVTFNGAHFTQFDGFAPYGTHGIFEAIPAAAIAFAYLGFRQGIELAGETSNPRRNVPLTVVGSVVLCGVLYILLQVAFIGAAPTDAIAAEGWQGVGQNFTSGTDVLAQFGPLAAVATVIGLGWLAVLLYADAIVSPGDTGLIFTGVTARMSYAMGRNRNAPAGLAAVSRRTGIPWVSLLLAFVVGCVFFLPFPGWQQLVTFVTDMTLLSFGTGPIVMLTMRRQLPDRERPFRLKGAWAIGFLALLSTNLIIYWAGWATNWKMFVAILLGLVLLGVHELVARGTTPPLDFRHGWWVLAWFGGLCLVSYLGSYPVPSEGAGNRGLFNFEAGIGVNVALTALVLWLAYISRLPSERVEQILRERDGDGAAPEPQPGT